MEILNNRECAVLFWLAVLSLYIFTSSKEDGFRRAFINLCSTLFVKKVIIVLFYMLCYVGVVVYWLSELGLWNSEQLKNTIFWCASVGFMSLFKLESIKKDKHFFKHSVTDNLKLLAVFQFVVGVYTFPLWIEILLVPILAMAGAMFSIAESDKKYHQVRVLLEHIFSLFGFLLIVYTIYKLTTDFAGFGKINTVYDFFVPPLLTLCYLPFIYSMLIYSTYEQEFLNLEQSISNKWHVWLAKIYAILFFNVQLQLLKRWRHRVRMVKVDSYADLWGTFKYIFKVMSAEKSQKDIPKELGWNPYRAKEFLMDEGVKTGFYNELFENEWFAASQMNDIGEGFPPDNIAYYIEGTKDVVKVLKIKLNVNDAKRTHQALDKLDAFAERLSFFSLNEPLSIRMKNAILQCESYTEKYQDKTVSLLVEKWPDHKFHGYEVKFIISSM